MGKQITKCTRKNTLFSSNVEHVYRPPGRHKQRGTTSNLLSRPLFGCQPVYSLSRLTTPQRWIRLQLCDACGWFLFSSAALQPLKGLADEESVCGHLMPPRMPCKCFSAFNSASTRADVCSVSLRKKHISNLTFSVLDRLNSGFITGVEGWGFKATSLWIMSS